MAIVTRSVTPAGCAPTRARAALDADAIRARSVNRDDVGMGAELGNPTQNLHARGPIGVRELCTFKYVVAGDGHVRP